MMVAAYFKADQVEAALKRLQSLAEPLRPTHFGSSERQPAPSNRIGSTEKYERFLRANRGGYFLFADRCRFDATLAFHSGYATIYVDPIGGGFEKEEAIQLFDLLLRAGSDFSFACERDEYLHRNRFAAHQGANSVEAWVGRDLGRYLPGMYWLTGMANEMAKRSGVNSQDLPPGAAVRQSSSSALIIEMPGPPNDWRVWARDVDAFCSTHLNVFSIDRVRPGLLAVKDYAELAPMLARWR